jgi:hypothetical protein
MSFLESLSPEATRADEMIGSSITHPPTDTTPHSFDQPSSELPIIPLPYEAPQQQHFSETPKEPQTDIQLSEQGIQSDSNTPQNIQEKQSDQPLAESTPPETKPAKKGRKLKSETSTSKVSESTHQALSKAGKKGAAKRWGKPLEKEEGGPSDTTEPSTSTKPQKAPKTVDPEISSAFSKIGYMGGKARGGEDSKAPIDPETHEALSKAGKLGAAKRWGKVRESQGQ